MQQRGASMAPGRAEEGGPRVGSGDWRRVSGLQPNRPGFWTRPIPAGVELGLGPTLDLATFLQGLSFVPLY